MWCGVMCGVVWCVVWYDVWCGMVCGVVCSVVWCVVCCSDQRREALLSDKKFSLYSIIFLSNNNIGFHITFQILSTMVQNVVIYPEVGLRYNNLHDYAK